MHRSGQPGTLAMGSAKDHLGRRRGLPLGYGRGGRPIRASLDATTPDSVGGVGEVATEVGGSN